MPTQMTGEPRLLRRMQAGGARIFFGHDAQFWKTVPQAPAAIS